MTSSALKRWLDNFLASAKPGSQLPYDRVLAGEFQISAITVRRALSDYACQGKVVRIRGKGTFVPGELPSTQKIPAPSTPESIARELTAQIARGEIKEGEPLPGYKSLRYIFKVSPATIHRAYELLTARELACKVGRSYRVGTFSGLLNYRGRSEIVLFYDQVERLTSFFTTHEAAEAFKKMEHVLYEKGFTVIYEKLENCEKKIEEWRKTGTVPSGIIATGSWIGMVTREQLKFYLSQLARLDKPHDAGKVPVLVVTVNDIQPARAIHYLSVSHANTVARRRLAQLVRDKRYRRVLYFVDAGRTGAGRSFSDAMRFFPEVGRLCPKTDISFVIKPDEAAASAFGALRALMVEAKQFDKQLSKYRPVPFEETRRRLTFVRSFEPVFASARGRENMRICSVLFRIGLENPTICCCCGIVNRLTTGFPEYLTGTISGVPRMFARSAISRSCSITLALSIRDSRPLPVSNPAFRVSLPRVRLPV